MAKGWTVVRMIMILDVDVTAERRHYNTHRPLKGKRLTGFCTSLTLPYKSSSHSAKCVRCASLCSGGRRLAVRKTIEYQIGALPRTPFPAAREFPSRGNKRYEEKNRGVICFMYYSSISPFGGWRHHLSAPLGSVSLDSQSPTTPCKSNSLATAAVRWGGKRKAP